MFTIKVIYETGQEYGFTTQSWRKLNLEKGVTLETDNELITLSKKDVAYVINGNGVTVSKISGQ